MCSRASGGSLRASIFSIPELYQNLFDCRVNKERHAHIDVLINNAGAQFTEQRETTVEGHEKTMTINVFAPMLLTKLLLPLLAKSKSARVVTVASDAHRMTGKPDLSDIELKQGYTMPTGLPHSHVIAC